MMDMVEYKKHLNRMNYEELMAEKDALEEFVDEYEDGIFPEDPRWKLEEDPDVEYYHTLLKLKSLYGSLAESYLKKLEKKVLAESRRFNADAVLFTDPVEETDETIKKILTEQESKGLITE